MLAQQNPDSYARLVKVRRSRRILIGLLVLPLAIFLGGVYVDHRLRAFADHGQRVVADVVGYSNSNGKTYAELRYVFEGVSYDWNVGEDDAQDGHVPLLARREDPSRPYFGPPLTEESIRRPVHGFFWVAGIAAVLIVLAIAKDTATINTISSGGSPKPGWRPSATSVGLFIYAFVLGCLWFTVYQDNPTHVTERVFGNNSLHLPAPLAAGLAVTIATMPFAIVLPAFCTLFFAALAEGRGAEKLSLLVFAFSSLGRSDLRWAAWWTIGGLIYFIALCAVWIGITAAHGV